MLAWGEEYSFSPLEFANTPHYLERLTSSVAYDSGARFMDIWVAYFTNNRYFANRNKFVYVDKYNPNFVVLNQLNMMSTCIPWKEVEVVRVWSRTHSLPSTDVSGKGVTITTSSCRHDRLYC